MEPIMRKLDERITAVWDGRTVQLMDTQTNARIILSPKAQILLTRLFEEIVTD